MFQGPYNTPRALAHTPMAAIFWPLLAPLLFVNAGLILAELVTFGWASQQFSQEGSPAAQWTILIVIQALLFAAMSVWSERAGAGPFAGSLKIDGDWAAISALTGPVVLLGSSLLTGLLVGGEDPNWMFRDNEARALLSREAIGLSMIAAAAVLMPITEEMAFRGIALGCLLSRGVSPLFASLVTAAVFAGIHQQYTLLGMLPVFIMGLYLGWLRVATGSIAAPILAHMTANTASLGLFIAATP